MPSDVLVAQEFWRRIFSVEKSEKEQKMQHDMSDENVWRLTCFSSPGFGRSPLPTSPSSSGTETLATGRLILARIVVRFETTVLQRWKKWVSGALGSGMVAVEILCRFYKMQICREKNKKYYWNKVEKSSCFSYREALPSLPSQYLSLFWLWFSIKYSTISKYSTFTIPCRFFPCHHCQDGWPSPREKVNNIQISSSMIMIAIITVINSHEQAQ